MTEEENHDQKQKLLVDLLNKISQKYQTISLADLAQRYGYTSPYLSSLIKELTGKNFVKLCTQKRLEQAKYLLSSSDYPITKICELVGIHNLNSFYAKFQQQYHVMPNAYRKNINLLDHLN